MAGESYAYDTWWNWRMIYYGSSLLIPTMDYIFNLAAKQGRLQAHLHKEIPELNYREFRTDYIYLPAPFGGKAILNIAYLNGVETSERY